MAIDVGEWNSLNSDLTAEFFKATLIHCDALHWKEIPKIATGDKTVLVILWNKLNLTSSLFRTNNLL